MVPIMGGVSRHLVSDKVEGWADNVVESHPSRFMRIVE